MVVRYMGTKRHMAEHVRSTVEELKPQGRVIDLFSGMGSVAESLQGSTSVITNDALSFTAAISRARFTSLERGSSSEVAVQRLKPSFQAARKKLRQQFRDELKAEAGALRGSRTDLSNHMQAWTHVGNSAERRQQARRASETTGDPHYKLCTLYFSGGYLSLTQAIDADALRAAIDRDSALQDRDWLLAAWIAAISVLINAPGHTAQFLRPNTDTAKARIVRTWGRSLFDEYRRALDRVTLVGTEEWRRGNTTYVGDALDLISSVPIPNVGAVYADPPYTKDQYSRYYHVYETLYRYDFPDSNGQGRNRSDRFSTGFSQKSGIVASFHDLCRNVARLKVPLVVSYPDNGLLLQAGHTVDDIARQHFKNVSVKRLAANHSTMGGSKGSQKVKAMENLYVCN